MKDRQFFDCGGCGCWHPFGWDGDCRDDSMRYTTGRLEEEFGDDWFEVCESCGSSAHSSLEHDAQDDDAVVSR